MHLSLQVASSLRGELTSSFLRPFVRDLRRAGRLAVRRTQRPQGVGDGAIVGLRWVDDKEMRVLNQAHMGKRGVTDVLSFPSEAPGATLDDDELAYGDVFGESLAFLGDIVLCWPECVRQAGRPGHPHARSEILPAALLLGMHGLAHLLGHDHGRAGESRRMHRLEVAGLRRIRVADRSRPYARRQLS